MSAEVAAGSASGVDVGVGPFAKAAICDSIAASSLARLWGVELCDVVCSAAVLGTATVGAGLVSEDVASVVGAESCTIPLLCVTMGGKFVFAESAGETIATGAVIGSGSATGVTTGATGAPEGFVGRVLSTACVEIPAVTESVAGKGAGTGSA